MITVNVKICIAIALLSSLAIAVAALSSEQRATVQSQPSARAATIVRAPLWRRWSRPVATLALSPLDESSVAEIRDGLFEKPVLLVSGTTDDTVLCVYDFDTGYRVIAFELDAAPRTVVEDEVAIIVPRRSIAARLATAEERGHAVAAIRAMSQPAYVDASLPAVDLGILTLYAPKHRVLERLQESSLADVRL